MTELKPISSFPPIVKLFVGIFTSLMLLVCLWAVWIYTVDRGEADTLAYTQSPGLANESATATQPDTERRRGRDELSARDEMEVIESDSETALAPIWDTTHAGEPEPLDSSRIDTMESIADLTKGYDGVGDDDVSQVKGESHLRHNLGLAHVHVNGQTLLFFALGAVFLFTTVKPRVKKTVLWAFALTVVAHTIGLTGEGYHSLFGDLLALSGVVLLALIGYMCLMIFVDLGRSPKQD
jgi:hypothetical protein